MRIIAWAALTAGAAAIAAGSLTAGPATAASRTAAPLSDQLNGIMCKTTSDCIAVGANSTGSTDPSRQAPLVRKWNGKAWAPLSATLPAKAAGGWLDAISCVPGPGTQCMTTGTYTPPSLAVYNVWTGLSDAWNGKAWTPTPVDGRDLVELSSVSCLSAKECLAVGTYTYANLSGSEELAYRWNGAKWTLLPLPSQGVEPSGNLSSLSCVSATFCIAGGSGTLRWNGSTWSGQTGGPGGLNSVSCVSTKFCLAVGKSYRSPWTTTYLWNGKKWTLVAPLAWQKHVFRNGTGGFPVVGGVSCVSATYCVAVGSVPETPLGGTLLVGQAAASVWNGKKWTVATVPVPGKGSQSYFNSVTCLKVSFCVAVGEYGPASGAKPKTSLTGFWNGKRWTLLTAK